MTSIPPQMQLPTPARIDCFRYFWSLRPRRQPSTSLSRCGVSLSLIEVPDEVVQGIQDKKSGRSHVGGKFLICVSWAILESSVLIKAFNLRFGLRSLLSLNRRKWDDSQARYRQYEFRGNYVILFRKYHKTEIHFFIIWHLDLRMSVVTL